MRAWTDLVQNRTGVEALVIAVMKFRIPLNQGVFRLAENR